MIASGIICYLIVGAVIAGRDYANDAEKGNYRWHENLGWFVCLAVLWPMTFFDKTK